MKKVLSIIVALAMVVTFSLPAFAFTQECWDTIGSAVSALTGGDTADTTDDEGEGSTGIMDTVSGLIEMAKGLLGNIDLSAITDTIGGLLGGGDDTTDTEDTGDEGDTSSNFMDTISGLVEMVKGILGNIDLSAITDTLGGLIGGGDDTTDTEDTGDEDDTSSDFMSTISSLIETVKGMLGGLLGGEAGEDGEGAGAGLDLSAITETLSGPLRNIGLSGIMGTLTGLLGGAQEG